jgi:hypothetical protein
MQKYSTFIFENYGFDEETNKIELSYSLDDDVTFVEKISLPARYPVHITEPAALDRAMFALHIIGGISYFKTHLPKEIKMRSGKLTEEQAAFWNDVYENGLGEFFYKNKIDPRGLINFPAEATDEPRVSPSDNRKTRVLTPIGGGKDSLLTVELLKKGKIQQTLLRVGSHPYISNMAQTASQPLLNIERSLSAELFKMNAAGALNGHVPITAYLSFLSIVLAELLGYSHVIFSNEGSASEGNTELFGKQINHQWSKSMEFEMAMRGYLEKYVTKNVEYFSLIRPFSELKVVEMFRVYKQYLPIFTSCNTNWRILKERPMDPWCGKCPKCAFAFVMLSAYLDKEMLLEIFDKNLFEDEDLLPVFKELLGTEGIKPFECVGTPEETKAAMIIAHNKQWWDESPVMKMFVHEVLPAIQDSDELVLSVLKPGNADSIPARFRPLLPTV